MKNNQTIVLLLLVLWISFTGAALGAQDPSTGSKVDAGQIKNLLDTWQGDDEVLNQAKGMLDTILAKNPRDHRALIQLSRYYLMNGYISSATRSNGRNRFRIGRYEPGTLERAEKILREALQIKAGDADCYVLLGNIFIEQQRLKEAREALVRAETIGTDNPWLHLNWAVLLRVIGDADKAADRCKNVLKSDTKEKKAIRAARALLIDYHEDRGEYKEVDNYYRQICKMNPPDAWTRGNYADFLRRDMGKFDEAIKYARESLSIMDYGVGRRILAFCLYAKWADLIINQKKPESEAQRYYKEAFQLLPDLKHIMVYGGSEPTGKAVAKLLVAKGIPVDARAEDGSTALIIACNTSRADVARHLLSLGANPNARSNGGWTALFGAADEGNEELVKLLLQHGADTSYTFRNVDAATWAQKRGRYGIIKLLKEGAVKSQ